MSLLAKIIFGFILVFVVGLFFASYFIIGVQNEHRLRSRELYDRLSSYFTVIDIKNDILHIEKLVQIFNTQTHTRTHTHTHTPHNTLVLPDILD